MVILKTDLRKLIIDTLVDEWPLSVKRIYFKVRKHKPVTYHAVYKIVKEMVEKGILEKRDKKYLINKKWIEEIIKFGEKLKLSYSRSAERPDLLIFNTVAECDEYFMKTGIEEGMEKFIQCKHLWWGVFRPEATLSTIEREKMQKCVTYIVCGGNSSIEKWQAKLEKKSKTYEIKLGVVCNRNCDVIVCGDTVFEIYYPRKLLKVLEDAYSKANSIDELNLKSLLKTFYKKPTEIIVSVTRNEKIANLIKQEILKYFR